MFNNITEGDTVVVVSGVIWSVTLQPVTPGQEAPTFLHYLALNLHNLKARTALNSIMKIIVQHPLDF